MLVLGVIAGSGGMDALWIYFKDRISHEGECYLQFVDRDGFQIQRVLQYDELAKRHAGIELK